MLQFTIESCSFVFHSSSISIGHLAMAQPQIVRILLFLEEVHLIHNTESSMNIASTDNAVKFTISPSQLFIYIPSLMRYLVYPDSDNVIYRW